MSHEETGGRFYVVERNEDQSRCLVEANTPSAALRRSAAFYCQVRPAKPAEIVEMMKKGCDVITVKAGEDLELPLDLTDKTIETDDPSMEKIRDTAIAKASDLLGITDEDIS